MMAVTPHQVNHLVLFVVRDFIVLLEAQIKLSVLKANILLKVKQNVEIVLLAIIAYQSLNHLRCVKWANTVLQDQLNV